MTSGHRHNKAPRADELAAYVDDQLSAADRERVERWLAAHPDAADELRAHEKVDALYRDSNVPLPEWNGMLGRIERGVAERRARREISRWHWAAAVTVAAAGLVLAILLGHQPETKVLPTTPVEPPLPVVEAEDVEIISVDVADARAVVIGEVPQPGVIVLMEPGDVTLNHVEKDSRADFGQLRWGPDQVESPMIWAPLIASDTFPNDSDD